MNHHGSFGVGFQPAVSFVPAIRADSMTDSGIVKVSSGRYLCCTSAVIVAALGSIRYPMAWHRVALNIFSYSMTAYLMKYSVPDCGMFKTFHT